MRGQRKPKDKKSAPVIQRSSETLGGVVVSQHGDKCLKAILKAIEKTRSYTIARDFDSCVEQALEREKNL